MSRLLSDQPNTLPVDNTNPHSGILDETGIGNNDGTPINEAVNGDFLIFFQRLQEKGGITPNTSRDDNVNGFQIWEAFLKTLLSINGNSVTYEQVGVGSAIAGLAGNLDLTSMGVSRVAVYDSSGDEVRAFDYDGTLWTQVGNAIDTSLLGDFVRIVGLSTNRIALIESVNDQIYTYNFDGTNWSQVGNAGSILATATAFLGFCKLADDTVALIGGAGFDLQVYNFDGTNWSSVGNPFAVGAGGSSITGLSDTRICLVRESTDDMITIDFDGVNWTQTGNTFAFPAAVGGTKVSAFTQNKVTFVDIANDEIRTYEFDGTDWNLIWIEVASTFTNIHLTHLTTDRLVLLDEGDTELKLYEVVPVSVAPPNIIP